MCLPRLVGPRSRRTLPEYRTAVACPGRQSLGESRTVLAGGQNASGHGHDREPVEQGADDVGRAGACPRNQGETVDLDSPSSAAASTPGRASHDGRPCCVVAASSASRNEMEPSTVSVAPSRRSAAGSSAASSVRTGKSGRVVCGSAVGGRSRARPRSTAECEAVPATRFSPRGRRRLTSTWAP